MKREYWFILFLAIAIALSIGIDSARTIPANTAVSLIGNNNVTFTALQEGSTGVAWFEYGMSPATLNVWTPNETAVASYTWTEIGSPLTSGETYWVAGCNPDGCDVVPVQFTMLDMTPLPTTTFGQLISNATQNKFNVVMMIENLPLAFGWLFPASALPLAISIVTALVLFAVFWGMAARTRGVAIPVLMCVIGAPYLLYQNQGLHLGIPVEFQAIAQGIFYAALAGIVLVILRK